MLSILLIAATPCTYPGLNARADVSSVRHLWRYVGLASLVPWKFRHTACADYMLSLASWHILVFWKASWTHVWRVSSFTPWSASVHCCCCSSPVGRNQLPQTSWCRLLLHRGASPHPAAITARGECHRGGNNLNKSMHYFLKCQSDFELRAIWVRRSCLHSKVWLLRSNLLETHCYPEL